ncbi:MAG: glycosyltransferase [Rhodopseudomonas sp.]|nr:glycosyltransferase [Rhodopseudomonas sp.]
MRTVLVFRSDLLPYSETFIKEQMLAYSSWKGTLVGRRYIDQLPLDGLDYRLLDAPRSKSFAHLLCKIGWRIGRPPGINAFKREAPALLHAHFGMDAVAAEPIAVSLGIPMVTTLHGYDVNIRRDWWERKEHAPFMRAYPRQLLQLAQRENRHFIAVSDAIRDKAISYGIPPEKIATKYIGVDSENFRPGEILLSNRPLRVLFVGRLVEKKGCEYLISAMESVQRVIPNAELTVIGDGPLRYSLEQKSRELGVCARFMGGMPHAQIKAELGSSRVFCLPSVRAENGDAEGFGLVLLEAQAAGVPVVTSALGGADEGIINGVTGFKFEERNSKALSECLIRVLSNPELNQTMAYEAREFVKGRFDIRDCTRLLESLYDKIVDGD